MTLFKRILEMAENGKIDLKTIEMYYLTSFTKEQYEEIVSKIKNHNTEESN